MPKSRTHSSPLQALEASGILPLVWCRIRHAVATCTYVLGGSSASCHVHSTHRESLGTYTVCSSWARPWSRRPHCRPVSEHITHLQDESRRANIRRAARHSRGLPRAELRPEYVVKQLGHPGRQGGCQLFPSSDEASDAAPSQLLLTAMALLNQRHWSILWSWVWPASGSPGQRFFHCQPFSASGRLIVVSDAARDGVTGVWTAKDGGAVQVSG